jgi:hypothetical protein
MSGSEGGGPWRCAKPWRLAAVRFARIRAAFVAAAVAMVAVPGYAAAAERFAAPNGTGTACAKTTPCQLREAAEHATTADELNIYGNRGPYRLQSSLHTNSIEIRGLDGRPRLLFSAAATGGLIADQGPAGVENLYVEAPDDALEIPFAGGANNVVAVTTEDSADTCFVRNVGLTNVVCWARGTGSVAIEERANTGNTASQMADVTAIASGFNGIGILQRAESGHQGHLILRDVIARGGPFPNGLDLLASTDSSPSASASITSDHSNFQTRVGGGVGAQDPPVDATDQSAAPVFVDAAHGDFHEACGSPTIDHGNDLVSPTADFDGGPRKVGSAVDIGADEFVPGPLAVTQPATRIRPTSASLVGAVNPRGCAVTYHFEYGTTTAYGRRTPDQTLARGSSPRPVGVVAAHLLGATRYHSRLVATSASGTARAADRTFTTGDGFKGVKLALPTATVRHGRARIRLRCPAGAARSCTGTLKLKTAHKVRLRKSGRRRRVALGRRHFSIAAGRTAKVSVKLSRAGRTLLKKRGTLKARARVVATDKLGKRVTTSRKITLKLPR